MTPESAIDKVMSAMGTRFKHYMPVMQSRIVNAMREVLDEHAEDTNKFFRREVTALAIESVERQKMLATLEAEVLAARDMVKR